MRILLADGQPKVRHALRVLLNRQADLEIIGEAGDAVGLLQQLGSTNPDLILLDWDINGQSPYHLVGTIHELFPHAILIAMSGRGEAQNDALNAGADSFISKTDPPERLLTTIARFQEQRAGLDV
jgi:DNA-binding NarL/FixJ family response regulator